MKVISKPSIEEWTHSCECPQCRSKLQADYNDLKFKVEEKYSSGDGWGDGGYYNADTYYVGCPLCDYHIAVNTVNIPYLLLAKAKKDSGK